MSEYRYEITIKIVNGEAIDYWCDHNDRSHCLPPAAWAALIAHARQDWLERKQAAAEARREVKR